MNTTTVNLNPGLFSRRSAGDWAFAALALLGMLWAFSQYRHAMDVYEQAILVCAWPAITDCP